MDNIEKLHRLLRGMAKWDREVLVEDEFAILTPIWESKAPV